jgi:transcriptional regulator with GAF, ATPase, and Fis domain
MRADIQRVARCPYNILITGETGTGKTEMARQVHRLSERANKPFIELNCANLPEHLVEAELFGHRKGAFTGADHDRKGLFEEAEEGILFLGEIGDIALPVQIRLLKGLMRNRSNDLVPTTISHVTYKSSRRRPEICLR